MMKKLLALVLALTLTCCAAAMAEVMQPVHADPLEVFASGDSTVYVHFDPAAAFDEAGEMAVTVLEDDLYPAEDVLALQPGDSIVIAGEEVLIESVTPIEEGGVAFNRTEDSCGEEFRYLEQDETMMFISETDFPIQSEMGDYVLPLAEQVQVSTWHELEPGSGDPAPELDTVTLAAGELKDFFAARSDESQSDYLSGQGNHITIRVQDGLVTEICVDWGADD